MMDGCADRGQGLARDGVFGEFFDSDHLLAFTELEGVHHFGSMLGGSS